MKITSIILAGGKNRRLGRMKALQNLGGKSLIGHVAERVRLLSGRILVVTSPEQFNLTNVAGAEILVDLYPGKGPLGGIYTGLLASPSSFSLVVACDMPFLNTELLRYLIELSPDFDAVIPRLGEGILEPLHAVYSRSCLDAIETELKRGHLRADSFLSVVRVRYVERAECLRFDPQLLSFFNINCQLDLERAIALVAGT
ncbi:MAG: molybdenum cofactor guanylyltransferase [Dehalococcoidales bacterium]